jgi:hypothetical protein
MCCTSSKVKNSGKEKMIGRVQSVSYSRAVFEVPPVIPVRGKEEMGLYKAEDSMPSESFFTQNESERLLDLLI